MTHTKLLKWTINTYVSCALVAWLAAALSGSITRAMQGPRLWIFPVNFELSLGLLFISLLAAYSLLHSSTHGRWLLAGIGLIQLLNMLLTDPLTQSSLVSVLEVIKLLALCGLLYVAWTNTLAAKLKRLQAYQHKHAQAKQQHVETRDEPASPVKHKSPDKQA